MQGKVRVLIVDDAVVVRRMLADILDSDSELEVVGTAANGKAALEKMPQVEPQVVILDIDMPEMNGIETLIEIRKRDGTIPVIMFSTSTERGASTTLEALSRGATDYVTKPSTMRGARSAVDAIRQELVPKIKALGKRRLRTAGMRARPAVPVPASVKRPSPGARPSMGGTVSAPRPGNTKTTLRAKGATNKYRLLAIGTSTGGPNALAELFPKLPANFPIPIVIVQHMPPIFTRILAERLTAASHIKVQEGRQGELLRPGMGYIAPGDFHMTVHRSHGAELALKLNQNPQEHSCRPAVDVLFRSIATECADKTLAVVLTGMGRDGAAGAKLIKSKGGGILAQDEGSSVVWGMPGLVAKQGLAEKVLDLNQMAEEITRRICIT
ncbi:MAG: chemotaxis response regulator protein-glutamate methylesterase [Myxococcota bacterium]|nr:chemotaxis response regulator protein-glutamate methylesterase [Myxococcota bacterium]